MSSKVAGGGTAGGDFSDSCLISLVTYPSRASERADGAFAKEGVTSDFPHAMINKHDNPKDRMAKNRSGGSLIMARK